MTTHALLREYCFANSVLYDAIESDEPRADVVTELMRLVNDARDALFSDGEIAHLERVVVPYEHVRGAPTSTAADVPWAAAAFNLKRVEWEYARHFRREFGDNIDLGPSTLLGQVVRQQASATMQSVERLQIRGVVSV